MASNEQDPAGPDLSSINQKWAREELAELFRTELGYPNVGAEIKDVTPFSIITELRNSNPDLKVTREQTLAELLESKKVPFTGAVRIGVLWGASHGIQTTGDTITRVLDNYNLPEGERIIAEETILGATKGIVKAYKLGLMKQEPSSEPKTQ